ncbi:protein disulfide isomerase CRELD2 isoform X2 [Ambystoma mexicanum]|uniref:protein disulfide isomerase CRELD2 isoform X2 n=1 Tax=Ambystoma mexicanum TaxID=8296 RepID=UPI0037E78EA8
MSRVSLSLALWLLLSLHSILSRPESTKQPCETCKKLVQRFHKGLEDTAKKNFGGGNTAWEEKTLSKYETSEIRLVEIVENLCDSSDFECNHMVEEHEEHLEIWWFKMKRKHSDLLKWLCIETIEVCCPPGTYGPDCFACLGGSERPCHGNGFCSGDGTRSGDGSCRCKVEYSGEFCLECADGYYSTDRNDTHAFCTACHVACKTCTGATNNDCNECKEGWMKNDEDACSDVDECAAEEPPCKDNEYCLNSDGSYACKVCHQACKACTGESNNDCKECNQGWTKTDEETCTDVDECAVEETPCKDHEYCSNSEGSYACKDINECNVGGKVCLKENEECFNTPGSYKCTCSEGFEDKDGECVQKETDGVQDKVEETLLTEPAETNNKHEDL